MTKNIGLKARLRNADKEERTELLEGLPYEVGFGKPPRATRFKHGNKAGQRGRPKGSENVITILEQEAAVPIEVTDGGKRCKMSKRRVGLRQLANKVASGDIKALTLYLELLRKAGLLQPAAAETPVVDERDLEMVQRLAAFFDSPNPAGSQKMGGEA
jgi:hypothetical protein